MPAELPLLSLYQLSSCWPRSCSLWRSVSPERGFKEHARLKNWSCFQSRHGRDLAGARTCPRSLVPDCCASRNAPPAVRPIASTCRQSTSSSDLGLCIGRSLVVCEPLGLWCAGHANGTIVLRLLQSLDLDGAPPAQQGQAVGQLQPPAEHATIEVGTLCCTEHSDSGTWGSIGPSSTPSSKVHTTTQTSCPGSTYLVPFKGCAHHLSVASVPTRKCRAKLFWHAQAHRSGLEAMVGCSLGVITASPAGSITLFPEAELRHAAEASGFVLPSEYEAHQHLARLHSGDYPDVFRVKSLLGSAGLGMYMCALDMGLAHAFLLISMGHSACFAATFCRIYPVLPSTAAQQVSSGCLTNSILAKLSTLTPRLCLIYAQGTG